MIKVGSDFSGVGAFNQALIRLGVEYKEVFACDMDKYARETFIHNYGEPEYYPTNVYDREIPSDSLDIYMTSPPCQAFSLAGKRLGKDDKRGILFFNSYEFIQVNKPRFFIFENVRGLLSDDSGNTFQEWCNMLGGKSVNGVPQNRERVFLIGIRDDADNRFQFPREEHLTKRLKDVLEDDVEEKYFLSEKIINDVFIDEFKVKSATQKGYEEATIGDSINYTFPSSKTRKGRVGKGVAQTLDTACNQGTLIQDRIRRLTPRECFRLMDFPDSFTWICSDSQAYKQAGNSIVVNVLYKILKQLPL